MQEPALLAAVDLGSNSFRLEIGRLEGGRIRRVEYLRETVRQGGDLDADHNLTPAAIERGLCCLRRFARRLAEVAPVRVRAVATQTLREAGNREEFLRRASAVLGGVPVEAIAGAEEARLTYLGVAQFLPASRERRLVVDIGGRSTELVVGRRMQPLALGSYAMGSVSWSLSHFPDGALTQARFDAVRAAAGALLGPALTRYRRTAWDSAHGASGTLGAVAAALAAAGGPRGVIARAGLLRLREQLLHAGHVDRLELPSVRADQRAILGGGLAITLALFELLDIERLQIAQGALRQGLLHQLAHTPHGAAPAAPSASSAP